MHVNKVNQKRYIGISKNPLKRWCNGHGYYRNKHFHDAIVKYGWDNFDHVILRDGLSITEACEIERALIKEYNTQDKRYGYNITDGGECFNHSEESKILMSERRKGKGRAKFSKEQIEKMKANHAGGSEKQPVFCIELNITFECINDAARKTGINKKGISGCCRKVKHYNTAGGYHWKYANEV